jgi:hypothetical protein
MGLNYLHLDAETRAFMVEEIEMDGDKLYLGQYLSPGGQGD